jgi:hypothetical protein
VQTGRTAVQLAAFKGSDRCLRRILHAGANPDSLDKMRYQACAALADIAFCSAPRTVHKSAVTYLIDATCQQVACDASLACVPPL